MEVVLREAIRRGVKMAMGTDAGIMPHGDNAKEFGYYVRMGMTPMQAIETGTVSAAALLDMEDEIGHLASGMAADIVATDDNPLDDIIRTPRRRARALRLIPTAQREAASVRSKLLDMTQ